MLSSCNELITLKEKVLCLEKNKSEKLKWLQTYTDLFVHGLLLCGGRGSSGEFT